MREIEIDYIKQSVTLRYIVPSRVSLSPNLLNLVTGSAELYMAKDLFIPTWRSIYITYFLSKKKIMRDPGGSEQ